MTPRPRRARCRSAFTFVEVMIVVAILGIVMALAVPRMGSNNASKLRAAANLLVADLEYAQSESIAHPDDTRVVTFNTANATYTVAASSAPATPLTNPIDKRPYSVTFGAGRVSSLQGVTISATSVGTDNRVGFGVYGQLDQSTAATVTLACSPLSVTITLDPITGVASIGTIQ